MLRRGKGTASMMASSGRLHTKAKKNAVPTANSSACENIALDVSRGGTSATQLQKFHTVDANQCLHNKSGSHAVPNINLSNFSCLLLPPRETSPAAKSEEKRMFSQATNS